MSSDPDHLSRPAVSKKVDESWKESVQKEKGVAASAPASPQAAEAKPTDARFVQFLSSLGMQALMFLGEIEDPMSGAPMLDLQQAKYVIDVLRALQKKTEGNLSPEESQTLQGLLYELQMKFSEKAKTGAV